MNRSRFWGALFAATAASLGLLWLPCKSIGHALCIPLGVPGEWTWNRIPVGASAVTALLLGWSLAAVAFLAYGAVIWLGLRRLDRCSRTETAGWLTALVAVGFFWLSMLQESPPEGYRTSKTARVLYYPGPSGYFFEARYGKWDVRSFLGGYESRMAEGDVGHVGTHPPGLFLFHRGLIVLCDRFPQLVEVTRATQPKSLKAAFSLIAANTKGTPAPLLERDRAALWLAALITQFFGVLAVVPLYFLIRRTHTRQVGWMAAAFWPLVPALAIFLPKSDALYPFLGLVFLLCWLEGCRKRSPVLCAAAGLIFWLGTMLSLALLPVGLLGLLLAAWESRFSFPSSPFPSSPLGTTDPAGSGWRRLGAATVWATASFLVLTAVLWVAYDVNLLNVWRWNVINHAAFYNDPHFTRTYWKWLLVNPLELSLAVGLPIALLALVGFRRSIQSVFSRSQAPAWERERGWRSRQLGTCCCIAVTIVLLWLSGKNSGEAARLWLFLMPWLIWLAADGLLVPKLSLGNDQRPGNEETDHTYTDTACWRLGLICLGLQALVCVATVTRVSGFHYY